MVVEVKPMNTSRSHTVAQCEFQHHGSAQRFCALPDMALISPWKIHGGASNFCAQLSSPCKAKGAPGHITNICRLTAWQAFKQEKYFKLYVTNNFIRLAVWEHSATGHWVGADISTVGSLVTMALSFFMLKALLSPFQSKGQADDMDNRNLIFPNSLHILRRLWF